MSRSPETAYPSELAEIAGEQPYMDDELRHECGVMAVCADNLDMARQMKVGLERMKHRGHDSAGVGAEIDGEIVSDSSDGAPDNLFDKRIMDKYRDARMIIGGTRYATTGSASGEMNRQPFRSSGPAGEVLVAINGNMINTGELRDELASRGIRPRGDTDSELVAHYLANGPGPTVEMNTVAMIDYFPAGYSGVAMTKGKILGFRDGFGVRPLHLGKVEGGGWAFASETRVFRSLQHHPKREVARGEVMRLEPDKRPVTISHTPNEREASCVFEHIYFSGPESAIDGRYMGAVRDEMGRQLAREDILRGTVPDVDVMFGLPESGWSMGEGYAEELARQGYHAFHKRGIIRNRGRSFNDPDPKSVIEEKFNPLPHVIGGKRVCVVDDSVIRGNTAPYILDMLRDAGATEVHLRVASPPFIDTCHKGVNIATQAEEIANRHDSLDGICQELGASSLQYLSVEGTLKAVEKRFDKVCMGCMTGVYPMHIPDKQEPHLVSDDLDGAPDKFGLIHIPRDTSG